MQFDYPTGFTAGVAPATLAYGPESCGIGSWPSGGTSQTYVAFWFKYSSNWYNEGASNKLGEVWDNYSTVGTYIDFAAGTVGFNPLTMNMENEGYNLTTQDWPSNVTNTVITLNGWHLLEVVWTYTATGQPGTATYQRWLDGVLQATYTNVPVNGTGIGTYQFYPDWGGGGNSVPADQYLWLAHIRITGHP